MLPHITISGVCRSGKMSAPSPQFNKWKSWLQYPVHTVSKKFGTLRNYHSLGVPKQYLDANNKQQQKHHRGESYVKGWKVRIRKFRDAFHIREDFPTKGNSDNVYEDSAALTIGEVKTVTFGKVEIRQHGRILSDHPACSDGLALGLDWQHCQRTTIMEIDLYERRRRQEGRNTSNSLRKLNAKQRCQLLLYIGCVDESELRRVYTRPREATAA